MKSPNEDTDDLIDKCFNLAQEEASKVIGGKLLYYHGAVLVKNNKIICSGRNHHSFGHDVAVAEKISGRRLRYNGYGSVHAEVDCFKKIHFNTKITRGSTLFIFGMSKARNIVKSRPCESCIKICETLGVKRIIYSNTRNTRTIEDI